MLPNLLLLLGVLGVVVCTPAFTVNFNNFQGGCNNNICDPDPFCDLQALSDATNGWTEINGAPITFGNGNEVPMRSLVNETILLDTEIDTPAGWRIQIVKGTRLAGTRVGIHTHPYGGYTTILSGTMTDYVQGVANAPYGPNSAYYMPPCTPMAAVNLGTEDVVLIDTFIYPPNKPFITVREPGWESRTGLTVNQIGSKLGLAP